MKRTPYQLLTNLLLLALGYTVAHAQSPPQLRLDRRTNALELTVSSLSSTGALFIYQATNLQTLVDSPSLVFETNNASTNDVAVRVTPAAGFGQQAFFSAAHWPGLSTDAFGDPENYPDEPSPEAVLVTAGVPEPLVSGQQFTVDFFIIDPAGQLLNLTQAVSVRVLRESDGAFHPNAQVSPSGGQLDGGHLRLTITVTASTSLEGYTLGLGPGGVTLLNLTSFLKTAFTISTNISVTTSNDLYLALEARRTANTDPNPVWGYPLSGTNYPVVGTFGEWRGDGNTRVHKGLDLAALTARVYPSRSGTVSFVGLVSQNKPCLGHCVVIDHGGGWFSLYLHLATNTIGVKVGQAVVRGQTTLATNLLSGGCIGTHLHFEIQRTNNASQWNVRNPGSGQDPLQIATINPGSGIFGVPPGVRPPELEEFGLTGTPPGQNAFIKPTTSIPAPTGSLFVYARFLDREAKASPNSDGDGGFYRLGLRAIGFQPDGVADLAWIWPSNQAAIDVYLPSAASGKTRGFAKYKMPLLPQAQHRTNYYRYWWKWDTSVYTSATGPRSLVLTGVDYGGSTSNYTFTFGPQVLGVTPDLLVAGQYFFTNVAYLGTNNLAALTQPDRYKLEIVWDDGTVLPGVQWTFPVTIYPAYGVTPDLTSHLQTNTFSFTLPQTTPPTPADRLKLRVSSLLVTNIAHEVPLQASPCDCPITSYSVPVLVDIPAGTFTMGSPDSELARWTDEGPQTPVTISHAFKMGKYEVTQAEYLSVMGANPSYFPGDLSRPVEQVSWLDASNYCCRLTACEARAGRLPAGYAYRLPTEAEWEYACRAGTTTPFHYGNELRSGMANFYGYYEYLAGDPYHYNAGGILLGRTTSVGSYAPNAWGLYDMHGNVWEWCQDWYGPYSGVSVSDPQGPPTGLDRVIRGGSWSNGAYNCRSAQRVSYDPTYRYNDIGFRVVLAPGQ